MEQDREDRHDLLGSSIPIIFAHSQFSSIYPVRRKDDGDEELTRVRLLRPPTPQPFQTQTPTTGHHETVSNARTVPRMYLPIPLDVDTETDPAVVPDDGNEDWMRDRPIFPNTQLKYAFNGGRSNCPGSFIVDVYHRVPRGSDAVVVIHVR